MRAIEFQMNTSGSSRNCSRAASDFVVSVKGRQTVHHICRESTPLLFVEPVLSPIKTTADARGEPVIPAV